MELKEITKIMKLKVKYIFLYLLAILFSIFVFSSSELNNDIPHPPDIITHGYSVYSPTSENYHPKTISESPDGMYDCQECHGAYNALNADFTPDTTGGITGVSCNTFNCHPTIGVHVEGIIEPTSENFHGKYISNDQWDMSGCQSCHAEDYSGGFVSPTCLIDTYWGTMDNFVNDLCDRWDARHPSA